jgi:hypothetical protein
VNEAKKGAIQFVEARENAAKVFEFVETAFDEMPLAVQPRIVLALALSSLMGRDHRLATALLQIGDELCSGIAAIRDHFLEDQSV